mmetsp:Transcript_7080/g.11510  ORF Transcript_7080/g.11510 Transcript_7080/m.11510 type:complete len:233 (+) Transcript_7080:3028-3726(+)
MNRQEVWQRDRVSHQEFLVSQPLGKPVDVLGKFAVQCRYDLGHTHGFGERKTVLCGGPQQCVHFVDQPKRHRVLPRAGGCSCVGGQLIMFIREVGHNRDAVGQNFVAVYQSRDFAERVVCAGLIRSGASLDHLIVLPQLFQHPKHSKGAAFDGSDNAVHLVSFMRTASSRIALAKAWFNAILPIGQDVRWSQRGPALLTHCGTNPGHSGNINRSRRKQRCHKVDPVSAVLSA